MILPNSDSLTCKSVSDSTLDCMSGHSSSSLVPMPSSRYSCCKSSASALLIGADDTQRCSSALLRVTPSMTALGRCLLSSQDSVVREPVVVVDKLYWCSAPPPRLIGLSYDTRPLLATYCVMHWLSCTLKLRQTVTSAAVTGQCLWRADLSTLSYILNHSVLE